MNDGQKKFYTYIMERVTSESKSDVERLLKECFRKQDENTFKKADVEAFGEEIQVYLQPLYVREVMQILQSFKL